MVRLWWKHWLDDLIYSVVVFWWRNEGTKKKHSTWAFFAGNPSWCFSLYTAFFPESELSCWDHGNIRELCHLVCVTYRWSAPFKCKVHRLWLGTFVSWSRTVLMVSGISSYNITRSLSRIILNRLYLLVFICILLVVLNCWWVLALYTQAGTVDSTIRSVIFLL